MLFLLTLAWSPPPAAVQPFDTCTTVQNVSLNGTLLNKYAGVTSTAACCQLCATAANGSCTAYSIKQGACFIFKDLSHMAEEDGVITGYTTSARTHYQDPARAGCAAAEEIANTVPAVEGSFCSAPCGIDDTWCPPDKPQGVTATPKCMVKDLIGMGMHCALSCKADSECGENGKCSTAYGPANGVCVYPPTLPAGMIQLVYGTTCPTGWKEKSELRGQVIAGAPEPAAGGTTNKQPALGANETGRVGPHGHTATATITDPGHTHANTLTDPGHTHHAAVTDPGHAHGATDPGHAHAIWHANPAATGPGGGYGYGVESNGKHQNTWMDSAKTGVTVNSGQTGVTTSISQASTAIAIKNTAASSGVTADVAVTAQAGSFYPLAYVIACVRV